MSDNKIVFIKLRYNQEICCCTYDKDIERNVKVVLKNENDEIYSGIVLRTFDKKDIKKDVKNLENYKILNIFSQEDEVIMDKNITFEKNAAKKIKELSKKNNLDIKIVDIKCSFDNKRVYIYYVSENRVDFREFLKDLIKCFHRKFKLKQICDRAKLKFRGGLGVCGREVCCKAYLEDIKNISIKMLKNQNIFFNIEKLIGVCGKLMCCIDNKDDICNDKKDK